MTAERDPLRDIFDGLVDLRQPTADQAESARQALLAVVRSVPTRRHRGLHRLLPATAAVVLALVIALIAAGPWNRTPAEAFLGQIAEAARTITPQELPGGAYVYYMRNELVSTSRDELIEGTQVTISYLIPDQVEFWRHGNSVEMTTTVGEPTFFRPADRTIYYDNGLDKADGVGETRTQTLTGIENWVGEIEWSSDPDELASQMRDSVELDHGEAPTDVKMMSLAARILDPMVLAQPALRAAVLDVLGTLDLNQAQLDDGRVSASTEYEDQYWGTVAFDLTFDQDGYLVARQETTVTGDREGLVPPGTSYSTVTYTRPVIVSEPGVQPRG